MVKKIKPGWDVVLQSSPDQTGLYYVVTTEQTVQTGSKASQQLNNPRTHNTTQDTAE